MHGSIHQVTLGLRILSLMLGRRQCVGPPDVKHVICHRYHLLKHNENIVLMPQIESAQDVMETLSDMVSMRAAMHLKVAHQLMKPA